MTNPNGNPKHGHSPGKKVKPSPTYIAWARVKDRCTNQNAKHYAQYAPRWYPPWEDFKVFLADMGVRPEWAHSIERIDNKLGYSPSNCRWATSQKEQVRNSSRTKLTVQDAAAIKASSQDQKTLAKQYGVSTTTIYDIRKGRSWL